MIVADLTNAVNETKREHLEWVRELYAYIIHTMKCNMLNIGFN